MLTSPRNIPYATLAKMDAKPRSTIVLLNEKDLVRMMGGLPLEKPWAWPVKRRQPKNLVRVIGNA